MEAICFADARGCQVKIVKTSGARSGRTRTAPTKVARIQGLRSHGERLVEQLASRALTNVKHKVHLRRDEDGRTVSADGEDTDQEDRQSQRGRYGSGRQRRHHRRVGPTPPSSPRDVATIAALLHTRGLGKIRKGRPRCSVHGGW